MKKRGNYIQVFSAVLFALLVIASPLMANATQLLEKPEKELSEQQTSEENAEKDHTGDHSASRIDQTIVLNGQGGAISFLTSTAKYICLGHYLPLVITEFKKYIDTAIDVVLLCHIKNILLFFTAPHAP